MENGKSKRTDKFFAGKGFYIVLALCVAVIGVSALTIALNSGDNTDIDLNPGMTLENPTEVITETAPVINEEPPEAVVDTEKDDIIATGTWTSDDVWKEPAAWVWPVRGEVERDYAVETLSYDVTMQDWRTHDGIDILAEQGEVVRSAADGKVESITKDDLYGTTVVIDHGMGIKSTYSNLADTPTVKEGDSVKAGDVIGSVGSTAICEISQGSHIHVAMSKDGKSVNPANYLPS